MAQTCIVCLGDLRALSDVESPAAAPEPGDKRSLRNTHLTSKKYVANEQSRRYAARSALPWDTEGVFERSLTSSSALEDDEIIAHLLPCGHDMHNSCLKPWVERANSCPICRTTFNMVELNLAVGGEVIDSYGVQDKVQKAEIDPTLVVEYDPVLEDECELCGAWGTHDDMVSCHFCEYTVHAVCAGFDATDDTQDTWACRDCTIRFGSASRQRTHTTPQRLQRSGGQSWRRSLESRARPSAARTSQNDGTWARIWMGVSRQLDLDLDFPFDHDEDINGHRTPEQRREFSRWQRRFELADRQGNSRRFHELATRLRSRPPQIHTAPEPESQDVLRAWNAFEKARESQEAPSSIRKRRRSHESTPGPENTEPEAQQLKRPRLRRPPSRERAISAADSPPIAQPTATQPTFLSSLLKEVEQRGVSAAASPEAFPEQHSPRNSSPARSRSSSACATPQPPDTPPPRYNRTSPLSSTIAPPLSPPGLTFSPFSPTGDKRHSAPTFCSFSPSGNRRRSAYATEPQTRGRPRENTDTTRPSRNDSSSPGATLSYSTKEEIQRMVKLALGSRYRDGEITKDQYTDINRDVSRKMYDMVGSASQLWTGSARANWQAIAEKEVGQAVTMLQTLLENSSGDGSA